MTNTFFTADHHFNHASILSAEGNWGWRDFSSVEEMNEHMITTWNGLVRRGDRVYHLGDFLFSGQHANPYRVAHRLNGQKYLIRGNHDRTSTWDTKEVSQFIWVRDRFELRIRHAGPYGQHLYLFLDHYPLRTWNRRLYGALHLFGHVHGQLDADLLPGTLDVGVDTWNYEPVHLDQVLAAINAPLYWHHLALEKHGD